MTVTRRIRSPGRARNKLLKPLRAGMPGDLGATCGDYARVLHLNFAREAAGATRTRHSPRPLFSWGERSMHTSGASCRGSAEVCLPSLRGECVGWAKRSVPTTSSKWWARRKRAFAHPTFLMRDAAQVNVTATFPSPDNSITTLSPALSHTVL